MGFWDFVAPDLDSFRAVMRTVIPDTYVGSFTLPQDALIDVAWLSPFSAQGTLARIYYEMQKTTGTTRSQADAVAKAVDQQGSAAVQQGTWILGGTVATLVIPNTYRCAIRMLAGGRSITNVIGVRGSSSGQQAAAAAAVLAAWKVASGPLSRISSLVSMADVTAIDLSSTSGGISIVTDTTLGGITAGNALSTRAASALISWNGSTRSKSSRGRLYLGPLMESDINTDGATLVSAVATSLGTAMTNFRSSLATAGFPLVVISQKNAATTDVTSHAVQGTIATQRRRIRS